MGAQGVETELEGGRLVSRKIHHIAAAAAAGGGMGCRGRGQEVGPFLQN